MGLSLLAAVGLPGYVANNARDYVSIATGLAQDVVNLGLLRNTLRNKMQSSSLMDKARMARDLEDIYEEFLRG